MRTITLALLATAILAAQSEVALAPNGCQSTTCQSYYGYSGGNLAYRCVAKSMVISGVTFSILPLSPSLFYTTLDSLMGRFSSAIGNLTGVSSTSKQPVSVSGSQSLTFHVYYLATGVASATYVSGGSFSGSGTCTLGSFNGSGGSGAAANITVSGNTPGAITITNTGQGYTGASTGATLTSGTATCSGTVTITSVLGGAQGNAIQQTALITRFK